MCSSPDIPAPVAVAPPPDTQAEKSADINATRRKKDQAASGIAGGTLLTGPSGVASTNITTGGGSLLGG
ncbi:hypothetical protein [Hydrogenophaga sp.]|uniref:hypothetical protein n=1 Tax=Hydrogenophaga sp. TaxID=1904254 RepID=UPI0025BD1898|nr:hypothetical protein [Hydrogenophaga sp.]MBT9467208.1 hypothetical protein [Hydrogenophaga sp.]